MQNCNKQCKIPKYYDQNYRWMYRFIFIAYFCSFTILRLGTSFIRLEIDHRLISWNWIWPISDNSVNIWEHNALNYICIQAEKYIYLLYRIWYFMCYVGRTCPQNHCLFDWTPCIVSSSFLFFDTPYFRKIYTILRHFLKELFWKR